MRTEIDHNKIIFHFQAPVTVELPEDALVVPPDQKVAEIVLDFSGVKLISSLVIANLIELLTREKGGRAVRFANVGSEMKNLLHRTGLANWLDMT